MTNMKTQITQNDVKYRAYCDASMKSAEIVSAFALVDADDRLVVHDTAQYHRKVNDIVFAELLAVYYAVEAAAKLGIKRLTVITDNLSVATTVRDRECEFKKSHKHLKNELLRKIRKLAKKFTSIKFKYQKRNNNKFADSLCHAHWAGAIMRTHHKHVMIMKKAVEGRDYVFNEDDGCVTLCEVAPVE